MSKTYICRHCKKLIEAKEETKGKDWIERSKGYYYHAKCWENFKDHTKDRSDQDWLDLIFYVIRNLLKEDSSYYQIKQQFNNFIKQGMTAKGIYFTVYWHFVIKNSKWEKKYGIGLVPHIYEESTSYWYEQERKKSGILKQIEATMFEKESQARVIMTQKRRKKSNKIDFP